LRIAPHIKIFKKLSLHFKGEDSTSGSKILKIWIWGAIFKYIQRKLQNKYICGEAKALLVYNLFNRVFAFHSVPRIQISSFFNEPLVNELSGKNIKSIY
jgi:hypothetical protein